MDPKMYHGVTGAHNNISPPFHPVQFPESTSVLPEPGPFKTEGCIDYMKGYVDCSIEAIRFLTEVEGLPSNHPFVVGLQKELQRQMEILRVQLLLQEIIELGSIHEEDCEESDMPDTDTKGVNDVDIPETPCISDTPCVELGVNMCGDIYKILCSLEDEESEIGDMSRDEGFHEH